MHMVIYTHIYCPSSMYNIVSNKLKSVIKCLTSLLPTFFFYEDFFFNVGGGGKEKPMGGGILGLCEIAACNACVRVCKSQPNETILTNQVFSLPSELGHVPR